MIDELERSLILAHFLLFRVLVESFAEHRSTLLISEAVHLLHSVVFRFELVGDTFFLIFNHLLLGFKSVVHRTDDGIVFVLRKFYLEAFNQVFRIIILSVSFELICFLYDVGTLNSGVLFLHVIDFLDVFGTINRDKIDFQFAVEVNFSTVLSQSLDFDMALCNQNLLLLIPKIGWNSIKLDLSNKIFTNASVKG